MIRTIGLSGVLAISVVGAAAAADMPAIDSPATVAVPSFSWSGPYLGLQVGYDWYRADDRLNGVSPRSRPDGLVVGAYAGYNVQFDNSPIVIGAEADIAYSNASARRGTTGFTGLPNASITNDISWNGAVRARLGYAFDRFLVYGAGGVAFADHEVKARGAASGSDDTIAVGWTIGGGVEAAVSDNVTARVEYRYSDYGADSFSVAGSRVKADVTDNRVLLGLGYKFSTGW